MTVKIRKGLFETNSSSCHSLTLSNQSSVIDDVDNDYGNKIVLGDGEYGWSGDNVDHWMSKADYLAIEADVDEKTMLVDALTKKFPNIEIEFSEDGYIDHQSSGEGWYELNTVDDVFNFLFGDGYIEIDNDNY